MAYLLDSDKKVCKGKRAGVHFDGKFYSADPNNGRIFIPYGNQELSTKVIMIYGDFA